MRITLKRLTDGAPITAFRYDKGRTIARDSEGKEFNAVSELFRIGRKSLKVDVDVNLVRIAADPNAFRMAEAIAALEGAGYAL